MTYNAGEDHRIVVIALQVLDKLFVTELLCGLRESMASDHVILPSAFGEGSLRHDVRLTFGDGYTQGLPHARTLFELTKLSRGIPIDKVYALVFGASDRGVFMVIVLIILTGRSITVDHQSGGLCR